MSCFKITSIAKFKNCTKSEKSLKKKKKSQIDPVQKIRPK